MISVLRFIFDDTNELFIYKGDKVHHVNAINFIHWVNEFHDTRGETYDVHCVNMEDENTPEAFFGCYDVLVAYHRPPIDIVRDAFKYVYDRSAPEEVPVF